MRSAPVRYGTAVGLALLGLAAGVPLHSAFGSKVPYLTFFFATLVSAGLWGFGTGVVTTLLGTLLASRFIQPGAGFLGLVDPSDPGAALRFIAVGTAVSYICGTLIGSREKARASQAAERNAKLQFQQVLLGIADAVISTGSNGRILWINAAAERFVAHGDIEVAGRSLESVLKLEGASVESLLANVVATKAVVNLPVQSVLQVDGQSISIEGSAAPVTDESGSVTGIVVTFRDVTRRRRDDGVLASQAEDLRRSNRDLEQFAYAASHDLQEPLRMVNTYTELLLRKLGDRRTEELDEIAGVVKTGIGRMNDLITDLLSFSQVVYADTQRPSVDSNAALEDALAICAASIKETSAEIHVGTMPPVMAHKGQLTQVFQNLISNALKYRALGAPPRIEIHGERRGAEVLFFVRDNGIGFEMSHAESIFGLFKRLHSSEYPGTGLGLAITQKIVERSRGRIWAESTLGNGATFYFTLPAGG